MATHFASALWAYINMATQALAGLEGGYPQIDPTGQSIWDS